MPTPTLAAEEYQFEDTGIKLNGGSTLPFVDVTSIDGLDNAPVRFSTNAREGMDGAWADAEFEDVRTVTIEASIYAPVTALETYLDALKANFAPSAIAKPFYFGTDAGTRVVFGKSTGLRYPKQTSRRLGIVDIQVQILCEDPRIYSPDIITRVLPGTLTLGGNRDSTGTITLTAGTNPVVTLSGSSFTFALTISAPTIIDLRNRTILRNDKTNVRKFVTIVGGWPKFVAGNNVIGLTGTGAAGSAAARSAWR